MEVSTTVVIKKEEIFELITKELHSLGFKIVQIDITRPWGGFFVLDEAQAENFANLYFPNVPFEKLKITNKLSPKILVVAPEMRLSWQYHFRRAEIWRSIAGTCGVVTSENDDEGNLTILKPGDNIVLKQGERHRLVGLESWGIVAEIWQHTDASNPSDESDIIRLQDDFGR
jgi:mannose-6-phosphate isomerase